MDAALAQALNAPLVSSRLRFEPVLSAHAGLLYGRMQDPRIYRWIEDGPPVGLPMLRERWRRNECRLSPDGCRAWLNWALRRTSDGAFVGLLDAEVNGDRVATNVGYTLFPEHWGKGYATEAVAAFLRHGERHGVVRFRASVSEGNTASLRVLSKTGFLWVGPSTEEAHTAIYERVGLASSDLVRPEEPPALPFADRPLPTIADLAQAGPHLAGIIAGAAKDAEAPYAPGKPWSRRQLAWHIADIEAAMANRLCRILAEDGPVLAGIPQNQWAIALPRRDPALAAAWFQTTRATIADLLQDLPVTAWQRSGWHSEYGAMTLAEVVRHLHWHAVHHAGQLKDSGAQD
jgi:ribosomal-protein-alanine N-acetyltransferase